MKNLCVILSMLALLRRCNSFDFFSQEIPDAEGGLRWRDLSVTLPGKRGDSHRFLVKPSSGFVQNGHVTAIIGPSGSGKSTLLAALSGTTRRGKHVHGSVWMESQGGEISPLVIS